MADTAPLQNTPKLTIKRDHVLDLGTLQHDLLPMTGLRLRGLEAFEALPIPDRVRHLWRYSNALDFLPSGHPPEWNGAIVGHDPLPKEWLDAGVQAGSIPSFSKAADLLGKAVPEDFGLLEALNTATWHGSIALFIPEGAQLDTPLRLSLLSEGPVSIPRVLIVAGAQSRARIIQDHHGGDRDTITNCVTEIFVRPGAQLEHLLVERYETGATAHLACRGRVERDAKLTQALLSLGGSKVKMDVGADLVGQGANSNLVGAVFEDKRQRFDHHTVHRHMAQHTWSNIDFKTALAGKSRSAYTGLIRIEENADFSEAYQESRNLLLSDKCHADAIPELEIMTNEVRCTHGATSAPVDRSEIFYLQSRGLTEHEATRMIVEGFFADLLAQVPATLRPEVDRLLEERLDHIEQGIKR